MYCYSWVLCTAYMDMPTAFTIMYSCINFLRCDLYFYTGCPPPPPNKKRRKERNAQFVTLTFENLAYLISSDKTLSWYQDCMIWFGSIDSTTNSWNSVILRVLLCLRELFTAGIWPSISSLFVLFARINGRPGNNVLFLLSRYLLNI